MADHKKKGDFKRTSGQADDVGGERAGVRILHRRREQHTQRDRIVTHLTEKGIPNMVYYPTPQHALPVFADEPHYDEAFKNASDYCARTFSLPMHPYLTMTEQETVIAAVLEAV